MIAEINDSKRDFFALQKMLEKGGRSAQLKFLIDFANHAGLETAAREELAKIDEVFAQWLGAVGGPFRPGLGIGVDYEAASADELLLLQEALRSGFRQITTLSKHPDFAGWEVDLTKTTLRVKPGYGAYGGPRHSVVLAVASDLVRGQEGLRIKECPHCKLPFFKNRKRRFCSMKCANAQHSRNYRRKKAKSEHQARRQNRKDVVVATLVQERSKEAS